MQATPAVCPLIVGRVGATDLHPFAVDCTRLHQTKKNPETIRGYPHQNKNVFRSPEHLRVNLFDPICSKNDQL
ncbi:MAG: hypothetical protein JWO95_1252 [Verrucomicrobiales bacterium]|nr:hypothetical protein [Verrucomicrobiales bacterium]